MKKTTNPLLEIKDLSVTYTNNVLPEQSGKLILENLF